MLSSPSAKSLRPRPQRSLRQEYEEFVLERIEEFKQQISRAELLTIADEAVRELEMGANDQLVLTEVLMLEHVDRLIMRRLNLPSYRKWRARHLQLRRAQREPAHWGIDASSPVVRHAQGAGTEGVALVVGASAAPTSLFLAAHDWPVVFIDPEVSRVEAVETRAAAEGLAARFDAYVVSLGSWFPEVRPVLVVLDPATLGALTALDREQFLTTVKERTRSGGVHHLLGHDKLGDVLAFAPEAVKACYADWHVERTRAGQSRGLIAVKP
ncbi:MAG: hypothetical protein PVH40_00930 [Gemmatimonadales bacterium]